MHFAQEKQPTRGFRFLRSLPLLLVLGIAITGCASAPGRTTHDDPWIGMNRGLYKFNDGIDRAALKPAAKAYKTVTPEWFRDATGRFFSNLSYPLTMVNQLLQGKTKLFVQDTGRFIANSTLGIGGLFDVADKMGMPSHDEDFGQTLAVWGVPSGPYLMLPLLGPSTLRDAPARVPNFFLSVFKFTDLPVAAEWGARGVELIDTRASLLAADSTLDTAYDRYGIVRDGWLQRREYVIYDGNPPEEKLEVFEDEPDSSTSSPHDKTK
jgi:phospholipid-binding lipoprotein MlaA